jgi:hypothetical protein
MIIKVGDEYLDFNEEIEIEKAAKLFEDISTSNGDFSYSFEIPYTSKNLRILTYPLADVQDKAIYQELTAQIFTDGGILLYQGYLRVEGVLYPRITASFFSGNNNWFARLTGNVSDLDFSKYDEELNFANVTGSWPRTEGIKYDLLDGGLLQLRKAYSYTLPDFVPGIFMKEIFIKCFSSCGLKLDGELLNEFLFNSTLIELSDPGDTEIKNRSAYIGKEVAQVAPVFAGLLDFDTDSPKPLQIGSSGNFDLGTSRYTADVPMIVQLEISFENNSISEDGFAQFVRVFLSKNGAGSAYPGTDLIAQNKAFTFVFSTLYLDVGDYLEMYFLKSPASSIAQTLNHVKLKITPIFLYYTFVNSSLPKWTKQKFVSNVIKLFNVIPSYNKNNSTVTFNLFDKIKSKEPIDLSDYIESTEVDFIDFISDYSQVNVMSYNSPGIDEVDDFNSNHDDSYNSGLINVDNYYIEHKKNILQSEFTSPYSYLNNIFDLQFEKLTLNDVIEILPIDISLVNENSGQAFVEVGNDSGYEIGDLVRIVDSTVPSYNGDWVVESYSGTNNIGIYGMPYAGNASLKITKLIIKRSSDDSVYLLIDTGPLTMNQFTSKSQFVIGLHGSLSTTTESPSVAFFNMPDIGRDISNIFRSGLSFDRTSDQISLIDQYFKLFEGMLNDPVKTRHIAHIPFNVFHQINFLRPIRITTLETSNLYYLNRLTGYKASEKPCNVELVKLSS